MEEGKELSGRNGRMWWGMKMTAVDGWNGRLDHGQGKEERMDGHDEH